MRHTYEDDGMICNCTCKTLKLAHQALGPNVCFITFRHLWNYSTRLQLLLHNDTRHTVTKPCVPRRGANPTINDI